MAMTTDHWNNTITVGYYQSLSITFGTFTLNNGGPIGSNECFIVKTNKDGVVQWAKNIDGDGWEELADVDVDAAGNIYVVGSASGSSAINLGGGINAAIIDNDAAFLAKYNSSGNALWVRTSQRRNGVGSGAFSRAIAVDAVGTIYWAGNIDTDTLDFGSVYVENQNYPTGNDSYVVKYTPGGAPIIGINTSMDCDESMTLNLTPLNNVVLTANYKNATVTIGGDVLNNPGPGQTEGAVVKLTTALNPIWARRLGGSQDEQIEDVGIDGLGNIYIIGGTFSGDMTFASTAIPNLLVNMFLVRYDASGNETMCVYSDFTTGLGFGTGVEVLTNEDIYITSLFDAEAATVGGLSSTYNGHFDSYLMRLDSAGNGIWVEQLTGNDSINAVALVHDEWGNLYVGGWWKGTNLQAGTNSSSHTGAEYDVFLTKYTNSCNITVDVTTNNATCGDNDGDATATVNGGTAPYTYAWTSGDTLSFADSLVAGMYQVTVTDVFGCTGFGLALVSDNSGPNISVMPPGTNDVSCNGGSDGTIQIAITGGTSPYDIIWPSTGDTVQVLSGLDAGPYDVYVTDAVGCVSMQTVTVDEPDPLDIDVSTTDANCLASDGTATATVSGGTSGYNYSWSSGGNSASETGMAVGGYMLTVTDANLCIDSVMVLINETGGPVITIDSVSLPSCAVGPGSVYISVSGVGPFNYNWSQGSTSEDLTGVGPGLYAVMVTDQGTGCSSMEYGSLPGVPPTPQEICIITVDSASGYNLVVWEKQVVGHIDYYNIYQEQTIAGVFNLVGSVPYDSLSQFVDSLANPVVRSFRYQITAVDTCGFESQPSTIHQTIHLSASLAVNMIDVNCSWNHYDGFWYGTYDVYRYSDVMGWQQLPGFPSTSSSWTDITVPGGYLDLHYVISIDNPDGCTSTRAEDHNSSRSNKGTVAQGSPIGINDVPSDVRAVLYPNPNNGSMTVGVFADNEQDISIKVYNVLGEVIFENTQSKVFGEMSFNIDITNESNGLYFLELTTDSGKVTTRFVKE